MKVYTRTSANIHVRLGEKFLLELESVPGAGYQWLLKTGPRLRLVSEEIRPSTGIGGTAAARFVIEAVQAGNESIGAEYRRVWERDPEDSVQVDVTVGAR